MAIVSIVREPGILPRRFAKLLTLDPGNAQLQAR